MYVSEFIIIEMGLRHSKASNFLRKSRWNIKILLCYIFWWPPFHYTDYTHSTYVHPPPHIFNGKKLDHLSLSPISSYRRGCPFFNSYLYLLSGIKYKAERELLRINCLLLLLLLFVYELFAITTYHANRTLPTSTLTPYLLTYRLTYAAD